jgi:hypothetical protein
MESEVNALRASGIMQPRGLTVGDLITRYIDKLYSTKKWGRSKIADLARLTRELGTVPVNKLNASQIVKVFGTGTTKVQAPSLHAPSADTWWAF